MEQAGFCYYYSAHAHGQVHLPFYLSVCYNSEIITALQLQCQWYLDSTLKHHFFFIKAMFREQLNINEEVGLPQMYGYGVAWLI